MVSLMWTLTFSEVINIISQVIKVVGGCLDWLSDWEGMFGSVERSEPAKGCFEGSLHWLESV